MNSIGTNLKVSSYYSGYWLSYLPRYLPGTIWGYMSRGVWLNRVFRVDFNISTFGSVLEMIVMALSAILLFLFTTYLDQIYLLLLYISLLLGVWIVIKSIILWSTRSKNRVIKWFFDTSDTEKNFTLKNWLVIFLYAFLSWALFGFITILTIYSITAISFSALMNDFVNVCGIYALSWVIGFLVFFVPSGLGVREYLLSGMLMTTLFVSLETGTAISVILRLFGFLADLFWIAVGLVVETRKKRIATQE